ncbi:MAG: hypothetical protein DWH99_11250, partial [Planctomycetota bacterium]
PPPPPPLVNQKKGKSVRIVKSSWTVGLLGISTRSHLVRILPASLQNSFFSQRKQGLRGDAGDSAARLTETLFGGGQDSASELLIFQGSTFNHGRAAANTAMGSNVGIGGLA